MLTEQVITISSGQLSAVNEQETLSLCCQRAGMDLNTQLFRKIGNIFRNYKKVYAITLKNMGQSKLIICNKSKNNFFAILAYGLLLIYH